MGARRPAEFGARSRLVRDSAWADVGVTSHIRELRAVSPSDRRMPDQRARDYNDRGPQPEAGARRGCDEPGSIGHGRGSIGWPSAPNPLGAFVASPAAVVANLSFQRGLPPPP